MLNKLNELNYINDSIYKLNKEIAILRSNINYITRKKLLCKTIIKLLSYISITSSIIIAGIICNTNLLSLFFSSTILITINILINNIVSKVLNNKYNVNEIKKLIKDKQIQLNEYQIKEKVLVHELNIIKEDYYHNKETELYTDSINQNKPFKNINHNIISKSKKKKKS